MRFKERFYKEGDMRIVEFFALKPVTIITEEMKETRFFEWVKVEQRYKKVPDKTAPNRERLEWVNEKFINTGGY